MAAGVQGSRVTLAALAIAAVTGFANLFIRLKGGPLVDFREVWIAGHVWRMGGNPYGADYHAFGLKALGPAYPHMWPYPPHIWALAIPFSLPGVDAALMLWNGMGLALLLGSAALLGLTFGRSRAERWGIGLALIAFVGWMTASGTAFKVGQTGFLVLFGLALLGFGIARGCTLASACAMALLMLKPQVGLVACAAVLPTRGGFKAVGWAVAIVILASLPALVTEGLAPTIHGYLANLALYRTIDYDMPIAMTGLGNIVAVLGGPDLPAIGMSLVGALAALALVFFGGRGESQEDAAGRWLLATIGATAGLAFLHVYDLMLAAPLIALLPRAAGARRALIAIGLLLVFRPENLGRLAGHGVTPSVVIASIGGLVLLAAAGTLLHRRAA